MTTQESKPSRHSWRSLQLRLTLWAVAIFVVIQVAIMALFLWYQRDQLIHSQDRGLETMASALKGRMIDTAPYWSIPQLQARMEEVDIQFPGKIEFAIFNQSGVLQASSELRSNIGVPRPLRQLAGPNEVRFADIVVPPKEGRSGVDYRARIESIEGADSVPYQMMVFVDRAVVSKLFRALLGAQMLIGPMVLLGAAAAAWIFAGVAIRPLVHLKRAAQELSPETISEQINLHASVPEVESLQHELEQAMKRLEIGFESQSRFISSVSHELRTPISVLLAEAETLKKSHALGEVETEFVDSVIVETRQLGRMIESLYLISRVRDGAMEPTTQTTNANDVLLDAVSSCRTKAKRFEVNVRPTLIESNDDAFLRGDPELYRIMIANPIRNAIRYSDPGQTVDVIGAVREKYVQIRIRDYGPGIAPDMQPMAFDMFARNGGGRAAELGMGLGLTIARSIARMHRGTAAIGNHEDGGCEVILEIPLASAFDDDSLGEEE